MQVSNTIVRMRGISKAFPGVKALDRVDFDLQQGEVHALLGENGAGKSTLMKILSGIYPKDAGSIEIGGNAVQVMTQRVAADKGIAIIHQELNMCQHLTVAENIFLGREPTRHGQVDYRCMNAEALALLNQLGVDLDPTTQTGSLQVSKQQMVEIAKALSIKARVLIMDEPTSALTAREIDELFTIIRRLKNEGCAIVYISHRLEELAHITDRVTIMRDGRHIITGNFADFGMGAVIAHMVGREIKEKYPHVDVPRGEEVLRVEDLNAGRLVRHVSFSVYAGEIVGIAGLMGAGRTETTRAIFGADPKSSGRIFLDGREIRISGPRDAIKQGLVLVPENRKKDGLCVKLSVRENIALPNLDLISGMAGLLHDDKERRLTQKAIDETHIKLSSGETRAENLSGGNQQKVVVSKWLARKSRLVIFDEPTRGIDVAAKVEIYHLMNMLKRKGIGCLFVSSEMPEILGVSDRILVMCDGQITGELLRGEATQERIMHLATRFANKLTQEREEKLHAD